MYKRTYLKDYTILVYFCSEGLFDNACCIFKICRRITVLYLYLMKLLIQAH